MKHIQWGKDFGPHYTNYRDFLLLATAIIIIMGIFFQEPILYVIVGVFLIYVAINIIYDRTIGRKLYMDSTPQMIRMYQGEKEELSFELENESMLPIVHGQFRFQIESIVRSLDMEEESTEMIHAFQKSFSLKAKGKTKIHFPFKAETRGVARVRGITYTFPHLFNFDSLSLTYLPKYFIEVIVFPKALPISGIERAFQMAPGDQKTNLSPFEEIQSPIGTRDYEYSDPFHRVNWKASAKTQHLQTNVYEKVVDMSYLFIVNIRRNAQSGVQSNHLMEQLLSYTAYMCKYALDEELPYELYINARTASTVPYLHLSEGEGRSHYSKSLELLARIPKYTMSYSYTHMVHRIRRQTTSLKTIVMIGDVSEELIPMLTKWSRVQRDIFQVVPYEDGAVLERWNVKDVELHA